ncbi:MAG TPA: glycosyltransferase family 2 protein [Caldilineae bacterium]|nr:glycosyltransferase family 2 protein [Caldilineae bacterium]
MSEQAPEISVVIPLYNEVENIPELYRQLTGVLEGMGRPYEIIIADDGSTDGSFEVLAEIHKRDPRVKVIRFRRNYGQTAGFAAGFERARGEWIVTMDADLQNDPADIPKLIAKAEEGYDVVSGWRVRRRDALLTRKIPSRVANWLIARVTGVHLHDYGCSLKVYHRDVVKNIRLYGELHRFVPAVASSVGITVAEVPVNHRARERGQSKYAGLRKTISRTIKVFLDLLTVRFLLSYSTRPIHIFGTMGLVFSGVGVLLGLYLTYEKLALGHDIGTRPLLLLSVLLVILGMQMISMGLLGEVMVRTYFEAQNKPIYVVREILE